MMKLPRINFSGVIAFFLLAFFASGTIGENYTDDTFVAPIFFLIIVFWLIGILFLAFKKYRTFFRIMWHSIPLGIEQTEKNVIHRCNNREYYCFKQHNKKEDIQCQITIPITIGLGLSYLC